MNLRAAAIALFVATMVINGLNNGFGLPQNTGQGNQHNSVHALVRASLVAPSAQQPWLVMPSMAQQPWRLSNATLRELADDNHFKKLLDDAGEGRPGHGNHKTGF